ASRCDPRGGLHGQYPRPRVPRPRRRYRRHHLRPQRPPGRPTRRRGRRQLDRRPRPRGDRPGDRRGQHLPADPGPPVRHRGRPGRRQARPAGEADRPDERGRGCPLPEGGADRPGLHGRPRPAVLAGIHRDREPGRVGPTRRTPLRGRVPAPVVPPLDDAPQQQRTDRWRRGRHDDPRLRPLELAVRHAGAGDRPGLPEPTLRRVGPGPGRPRLPGRSFGTGRWGDDDAGLVPLQLRAAPTGFRRGRRVPVPRAGPRHRHGGQPERPVGLSQQWASQRTGRPAGQRIRGRDRLLRRLRAVRPPGGPGDAEGRPAGPAGRAGCSQVPRQRWGHSAHGGDPRSGDGRVGHRQRM
ncbi:MAG: Myo-inositol 2-dehydrogenase, partial [uncultured Thermomicrobiales bacterium]